MHLTAADAQYSQFLLDVADSYICFIQNCNGHFLNNMHNNI